MAANAPAIDPTLFAQPVMSEFLGIEVINLKTGMMDICWLVENPGVDEEGLFKCQRSAVSRYT